MLEDIFLRSIKYIAEIHDKNLFHGDIKPANLFYYYDDEDKTIQISSDSGSLIQLDQDNNDKKYYIRYFTPGFASYNHVKLILNESGEYKDDLFKEDKYQLISTFKNLIKNNYNDINKHILEYLYDDLYSVSQIN